MKKTLVTLSLLLVLILLLVSCGGGSNAPAGNKSGGTKADTEQTYTVSFNDAGMSNQTVKKGSTLNRPADPEKANHIFGGWYTDAAFTTPVQFPLTINDNTTLYAKFYDFKTAFAEAREKTIGTAVPGFEYDYTLDAKATYNGGISATGKTDGNAKYSSSGEVSFYDAHTNSGLLFYDGTGYQIKRDNLLQKISFNENEKMTNYEVEEVDANYRFDSSSFAKALFEYDESQLKSIEKTSTANEYKLKTSFNASSGIALASKALNSSIVKKLISSVPENDVQTAMYVTFSDGKVQSYRYEMTISVSSIDFELTYTLTFKNVGQAQTITPRTFVGLSLSPSEIASAKAEIAGFVSAFAAKPASGYDFTVKTGVDFPSKNEINSTFQGSAKRKVIDSVVYFHNDIEIDSDYKNADLYKAGGIADVHIKRTRLSNGDVWNIEKKLLADATTQITPYTANRTDSYYLFDLFAQIENYTFVQKVTKGTTVTYSIGVPKNEVVKILAYLNTQLDLDPLGKATVDPTVFGNYVAASVTPDEIELSVEIKDGVLSSIEAKGDGEFRTALPNSRDFTATETADYSFSYKLTVDASADSFTPSSAVKDAK